MRRPTSLAPLNLGSSLSPLSSPDDENRPPPTLSDSGRFNFGHLQIDTQGVVPSSRDSGYSELTDDSGAFAAGAGAGAALDFGELQGLEIIGRGDPPEVIYGVLSGCGQQLSFDEFKRGLARLAVGVA